MAPDPHPWLKTLPLAPSYHPTPAEFQDPIAYILKIEKEASQFGICKIVPPLPPAPKKLALANLTRSFAARSPTPTFSTRQQQIGFCPRRPRPVQKPVWKSGHTYTLPQFESKAKQFEKTHLKNLARKTLSPLEIESLFWRACTDKPFSVEYANDMPGSGFVDLKFMKEEPGNVGESAWNMRGVSRGKGSLLRFMKEEIPGVTSPMVYVAMMFSWFAWHVEDHELHSMNYLHMGAGKTWYGVPRDAGLAFEDVVRVQGYCGEVNPLVTFAILGQKTTVMSPEVLIAAGIPCCRLVQNAGEFVVTFPGAYHTGFSHGFNCGEAANIATPEWLKVAKEAAIKRASTNYPPMVSHFQLLYALALSLCSSIPVSSNEPRSSRLKHKMKGEGEAIVKGIFVENVIQNNDLLAALLDKGSSCVVLPHNTSDTHLGSGPLGRLQMTVKPRLSLGLCSRQEAVEASEKVLFSNNVIPERKGRIRQLGEFDQMRGKSTSVPQDGKENTLQGDGLLDQGLLSCVTCGILSFACVAVIRPREAAARYLMSADCSLSDNQIIDPGETSDFCNVSNLKVGNDDMVSVSGRMGRHVQNRLDFNLLTCNTQPVEASDQNAELVSESATQKDVSALDLLACAYGDSSDSEEEALHEISGCTDENCLRESSLPNICSTEGISCLLDVAANLHMMETISTKREFSPRNLDGERKKGPSSSLTQSIGDRRSIDSTSRESDSSPDTPIRDSSVSISQRSDKDCSRMHVFCLEHAVEVERQLRAIGGVHIMLVCHPEYPKIEAEAKVLANELGMDHPWKDIPYREATEEAQDTIRLALEDEEAIPMNSDWAVKFGINLYYSASLSKSPLYSKQLPYNQVIYKAFGRTPEGKSPVKPRLPGRRQRRIAVAGRWCGKVWMSNQVHPYLAYKDDEEDSDQKVTPETDTEQADLVSPPVKKSGRKRKKATHNSTTKKPKRVDSEESDRIEDGPESTLPQGGRVLRTRSSKPDEAKVKPAVNKKAKKVQATRDEEAEYVCDVEGCSMSFGTKQDLALHKRNVCPVKGCGKKFFSHKYLVQHRKVHMDDRPLKCPWKGCKMTFKWPWARTEHIRVHTGDRPYVCREAGCSQTFRFVSDFSRHKRKTGHSAKKGRR